jgi:Protein of unknown function (DUF4031)
MDTNRYQHSERLISTLATFAPVQGHRIWAHVGTDDQAPQGLKALHAFANRLRPKREWFQNKPGHPCYDVTPSKHTLALQLGAVQGDRNVYVKRCAPVFWQRVMQRGEQ